MPTRYSVYDILDNSTEFYRFLRQKRNISRAIQHYETPDMYHPGVADRSSIPTVSFVWKLGDHYYKIAHQYYNDPRYWWVIAWYNGYPTEADISIGDVIEIPISLTDVLTVLGV